MFLRYLPEYASFGSSHSLEAHQLSLPRVLQMQRCIHWVCNEEVAVVRIYHLEVGAVKSRHESTRKGRFGAAEVQEAEGASTAKSSILPHTQVSTAIQKQAEGVRERDRQRGSSSMCAHFRS